MLNLPTKILKTVQIETAQATIPFANIDLLVAEWNTVAKVTSRHLVLIVNAASEDAVAKRAVEITINADAGATYNHQTLTGEAAVDDADRQDGINALFEYPGGTDYPFAIPGTTYANSFGGGTILFPHAFNVANHKVAIALGGAVEAYVNTVIGRWAAVAAITSLILAPDTGNFAAGSSISLGVIDERYLVEEILLAADGTPTFDNIPQGEGDLTVIAYARSDQAAVEDEVLHSINDDDTAANYPAQQLDGRNNVTNAEQVNQECAMISGENATALAFGAFVEIWSQYTKANQPHFLTASGYHETSGPTSEVRIMSGRRANIEPINKLHYEPNAGTEFKAGSLFSLYRVPKRIIERQVLTAAQAVITLENIPQNFEALVLHIYARSDEADVEDIIRITLNGLAPVAIYDLQALQGQGAVVTAIQSDATPFICYVPAANEGVNEFGGGVILFPGYAKTDRHKHFIGMVGNNENRLRLRSHRFESLNAITSIVLDLSTGPNFVAGTVVELEGVMRREGLPPSEGMRI